LLGSFSFFIGGEINGKLSIPFVGFL